MTIYLQQNAWARSLLVLLALILLALFLSFLFFEVFDIDGSSAHPFYWLEEGMVIEAATLLRDLSHLFAQLAIFWIEFFVALLMLTPLIDRARRHLFLSLSQLSSAVFRHHSLARSNLSPETSAPRA